MDDEELRILGSATSGIIAADDRGRIAFANLAASEAIGRPLAVGAPLTDLIPPRLRDRHREGFARYVETGESRLAGKPVRVPALHTDGSEVEVDLTIRIFRRPDGTRLAVASVVPARSRPPRDLQRIESAFTSRAYQLV